MRLFDFNRAPNPRRVRMFLAEKGIRIPLVTVNLYRMEQLSPEFLAINPGGTVPVLETDDGLYLTESVAICHYLEARYPEPALLGETPRQQALTLMWNSICEHEGMPAIAEVLRNVSPGFREHALPGPLSHPQLPALVERGRRRTLQFFDRVEQQLAGSRWLAGDAFSFADLTLLAYTEFAGWVDIVPTQGRPGLQRWYEEVSTRPSARA